MALVGAGLALEAATRYLSRAGVSRFRMIGAEEWPLDGEAWVAALTGATLILRAGFDDDPMLRAAVRLGIPVVVLRAGLSGRRRDLLPAPRPLPPRGPGRAVSLRRAVDEEGGMAVVAGTLAATEAVWRIARPEEGPRARHLGWRSTETRWPRTSPGRRSVSCAAARRARRSPS